MNISFILNDNSVFCLKINAFPLRKLLVIYNRKKEYKKYFRISILLHGIQQNKIFFLKFRELNFLYSETICLFMIVLTFYNLKLFCHVLLCKVSIIPIFFFGFCFRLSTKTLMLRLLQIYCKWKKHLWIYEDITYTADGFINRQSIRVAYSSETLYLGIQL